MKLGGYRKTLQWLSGTEFRGVERGSKQCECGPLEGVIGGQWQSIPSMPLEGVIGGQWQSTPSMPLEEAV